MLISCIVVVLLKINDALICCSLMLFLFLFDIFVVILGLFLFLEVGGAGASGFFFWGEGCFFGGRVVGYGWQRKAFNTICVYNLNEISYNY